MLVSLFVARVCLDVQVDMVSRTVPAQESLESIPGKGAGEPG